ncbi:Myb-like DNA-binding domain containing protein [Tritrichomonas foetus]|uniref:Myb-like DNA-binding domain containing protein n=1 Tax=Tritrichomonas foetus TaxID=1144522 RepID=A0A1J4L2M0_9EUKA|nr:Myb-like DNA-binding domain containing protein [Tritrichomonas foetus]|eukprot:OHT17658.1 Myb-like DNA-binding domain containing protein [Tritrichomonas foetus]
MLYEKVDNIRQIFLRIKNTSLMENKADEEKKNIRQMFSLYEDNKLRQLVQEYGEKNWRAISKQMPNRTTRQCRERYKNYLAPNVTNGPWTAEEDLLLEQKYLEFGPKWATIAHFFKNRSDVNIKNRWASNRHKAARTTPRNIIESLLLPKQQFLNAIQALLLPQLLKREKARQKQANEVKITMADTIQDNFNNNFTTCLDDFEICQPMFPEFEPFF